MDKEELLRTVLKDLNKKYVPGLYEFLFELHSKLYDELRTIEAEIDDKFLTGTIEELKATLREYWKFHMRTLDIFRNAQLTANMSNTRQEMLDKRLNA